MKSHGISFQTLSGHPDAMETIGVRQGMSIMHLGVVDTIFHSCDAFILCHKIERCSIRSSLFRMN